jgi:hypothetical protein
VPGLLRRLRLCMRLATPLHHPPGRQLSPLAPHHTHHTHTLAPLAPRQVEVCKVDSPHCQDGTKPLEPKDGRIALKAGRNSDQLLTALSMIQHMRVLNFNTMEGAFSNFTDPAAWAKFQRRLGHYTTTFCCLPQHPGWIWYDFFWDMPHKDRFGRSYDSWTIKYGDH